MLQFIKTQSSKFGYIKTSDALCNPISTDCLLKVREDDTCVYFHYRKDDDVIFYVGIGNYDRPYDDYARSKWWISTVKKHGYTIKVVHSGLSWREACKLEVLYIAKFGRRDKGLGTLVNLTDGGDGTKGYVYTEEQKQKLISVIKIFSSTQEFRDKISAISIERWSNPEFAEKTTNSIRKATQRLEHRENLSKVGKKRYENPEEREKMSIMMKKRYENPDERQKMADINANRTDEEKKIISEKLSAVGMEVWENRTQEQINSMSNKIKASMINVWANMTPEQREIRKNNAREGQKKSKKNKK